MLLADKVALLEDGTITHVGTHAELLATVPQYRYLLAADDELDDGAERACAWQDDETAAGSARPTRSRRHRRRVRDPGRRFATTEAEGR